MKTDANGMIATKDPDFLLRFATPEDTPIVREYARRLAEFEDMPLLATEDDVRTLLEKKQGEALIGYYRGEVVSFLYFTEKSSIMQGKNGMFVDMLYIDDSMRGKGLGQIYLSFISLIAKERGYSRIEWHCLKDNYPAINLYHKLHATQIENIHIFRFNKDTIAEMADIF